MGRHATAVLKSETPEGRRGKAGKQDRDSRKTGRHQERKPGSLTAEPHNPTARTPRLPHTPMDPDATLEYWRRPRTLYLKRRYADSKTELGAGERKRKHKEPLDGDSDIRRQRPQGDGRTGERSGLKRQRTTIKRKLEQGRKHRTPEQKTNTR